MRGGRGAGRSVRGACVKRSAGTSLLNESIQCIALRRAQAAHACSPGPSVPIILNFIEDYLGLRRRMAGGLRSPRLGSTTTFAASGALALRGMDLKAGRPRPLLLWLLPCVASSGFTASSAGEASTQAPFRLFAGPGLLRLTLTDAGHPFRGSNAAWLADYSSGFGCIVASHPPPSTDVIVLRSIGEIFHISAVLLCHGG